MSSSYPYQSILSKSIEMHTAILLPEPGKRRSCIDVFWDDIQFQQYKQDPQSLQPVEVVQEFAQQPEYK